MATSLSNAFFTADTENRKPLGGLEDFFSVENFTKLKELMSFNRVKRGCYLFWEGEEADKLYYIRAGIVKMEKTTLEGKKINLAMVHQGDLIGEYGNDLHAFSAKALEDVVIGMIQVKDLEELMQQSGYFAVQFMHWLGFRQRVIQFRLRDLLLYGKTGALASTLVRLSNTYGIKCAEGIKIRIQLTNTEIADFLGMTRESVNRLLNAWKEEGVLDMANGRLLIKRLDDLRGICHCPTQPACPLEICRF